MNCAHSTTLQNKLYNRLNHSVARASSYHPLSFLRHRPLGPILHVILQSSRQRSHSPSLLSVGAWSSPAGPLGIQRMSPAFSLRHLSGFRASISSTAILRSAAMVSQDCPAETGRALFFPQSVAWRSFRPSPAQKGGYWCYSVTPTAQRHTYKQDLLLL